MSKIKIELAKQGFEIIRDKIGEILLTELRYQFDYFNNKNCDVNVFGDAVILDNSEVPLVNVSLDSGNFALKDAISTDGSYTFNIDVYTKSKNTNDVVSDSNARAKCHNLLGVCRAILDHAHYRTLNMNPNFVGHTMVQSLGIAELNKNDSETVAMGRLVFLVRINEQQNFDYGNLFKESLVNIKIENTNIGYKYVL